MSRVYLKRLLALAFLLGFPTANLWAAPPQLQVIGNQVTAPSYGGCTLHLNGVNVDGMEYSPTGAGPTGSSFNVAQEAVTAWKSTIIRLPLSQDFWFGCSNSKYGGTVDSPTYQAAVSAIVDYCSSQNAYVILDLHWSGTYDGSSPTSPCGTGWGTAVAQQNMPDANAVTFWNSVASIYANNPAVLFDLYNEPHDVTWGVWQMGGTSPWVMVSGGVTTTGTSQTPGMQGLLNTIRGAGANNVCLVGGLQFAYDLTQVDSYPLTNVGNGIVYSAHIYGNVKGTTGDSWDSWVTAATTDHPVFVGEFGPDFNYGATHQDVPFDANFFSWLNGNNYNDYVYPGATAWSMNTSPNLLTNWTGYVQSSWGQAVSTWLATPQPTCVYTPTFTYTPTPCGYPGNTCTPTDTPTPTSTSTPTSTPNPNVDHPFPNPWPDINNPNQPPAIYHNITSQPDSVRLKLYTTAFRKVLDLGGFDPTVGQHLYTLPPNELNGLADGLYYLVVAEERGGQESRTVLKFLIRR